MAQATYSIRLDQDKKAEFDEICEQLGLSASAAFSTFVNKTVALRGLPYELTLGRKPSDYGIVVEDDLTPEELMAEIQKGIDSADAGELYPAEEVFASVLGASYARV